MTNNTIYYTSLEGVSSTVSNNSLTKTKPTGLKKVVRPNKYEPGRANIAIYNWNKSSSVTLSSSDLSGVGLNSGDTYELRNAQNYFGDIIKGTYNGSAITVPMSGRSVATPRGLTYTPKSTFPEFGAFVLIRTSTGSGGADPGDPVDPPTPLPPTTSPSTGETVTKTITPTADAFVRSSSKSSNYGKSSNLGVDASPDIKMSYIKFDTSFLSGKTVVSAKLKIKTVSTSGAASSSITNVYGLSSPTTSWSETTINYSNKPARASTAVASFKPARYGYWYTVDVTKLFNSGVNPELSLVLASSGSDGADYQSRETASKPQLIVTYR